MVTKEILDDVFTHQLGTDDPNILNRLARTAAVRSFVSCPNTLGMLGISPAIIRPHSLNVSRHIKLAGPMSSQLQSGWRCPYGLVMSARTIALERAKRERRMEKMRRRQKTTCTWFPALIGEKLSALFL